jgi:hypothetical protein
MCNLARMVEQGGDGFGALHGGAVQTTFDFEPAAFIENLQTPEFLVDGGGLAEVRHAHVDINAHVGGDNVGTCAAVDYAGIDGNSLPQVGKFDDLRDLARGFDDGARAVLEIDAGVEGRPEIWSS